MCTGERDFIKGKVSIVTPIYNGEAHLPRMLDSVLCQTYPHIEIILSDDGSTDQTIRAAESYREKFAARGYGYRIVKSSHKNASAAINQALPYVTGEYLIWPDSDDVLDAESVEKRVEFLKQHPRYQCVRNLSYYFDDKTGERRKVEEQIGDLSKEELFWDILEGKTFVCCGCYMLRSERFFAIYPKRHIPEYPVGQNFQMLLPYMFRYKCPTIRESLYGVCVREGSHSRMKLTREQEEQKYRNYENLVDELAEICGIHDQKSKRRIARWKAKRRYIISVKYGCRRQSVRALYMLFVNGGVTRELFLELFWRTYNRIFHAGMRETKMKLFSKKEDCCGCSACADVCQVKAIHMIRDKEGFAYPVVDSARCVRCGRCKLVCPVKNHAPGNHTNQYLGAQARRKKVRYTSSSGGVFPILAEYVLGQKGVVYGAGYNERMEVVHQKAENPKELQRLKRTKYAQSDMTNIFRDIRRQLAEKRWVLFCGTPCQAQALRLFLNREYDRLIIMDLVCYGVPSPGIWEDYVKYLERKHHGGMMDFSFRDKREHNHGHSYAYVINGREYTGSLFEDRFCRLYFKNYILRPSCHNCKFCTVDRDSDFTIGDFWGIEKVRPDIDDGMGTSLVILHTDKAKSIWEQMKQEVNWFECEKEQLLQPRLLEPAGLPKKRSLYVKLYRRLPFSVFIRLP